MNINIIGFIKAAILNGAPIMFGTSGEILTEKSGNMNLGVEGLMYMGGAFGLIAAFLYGNTMGSSANGFVCILIALVSSFVAGVLGALIFSFLTITLRANQNVTGLALTIFGTAVGQFACEYLRVQQGSYISVSTELKNAFINPVMPEFLQNIPFIGELLFQYNIFVYLGFVIVIAMHLFMNYSKKGLYLRSVGESPAVADAAGIDVEKYKYLATLIGGGISAIGGMVSIMTLSGCVWSKEGLAGTGWISVALVIFCLWKPLNSVWGSILFGGLLIAYIRLPLPFLPAQIYKIVPYIVTIIVLILVSIRQKRENQPPASLGIPYFREDR
ncbi:MAG: ABC transporter permease [Erysipelotrichaceae bacterium]|nr:ABC transporter permease [Erysipelotrichaceae bacterium]